MDLVQVKRNEGTAVQWQEGSVEFPVRAGRDDRYVLLVKNGDAKAVEVSLEAGQGLHGVLGRLAVAVQPGQTAAVTMDSMRLKQLSGDAKGCYLVKLREAGGEAAFTGDASKVQFAALQL